MENPRPMRLTERDIRILEAIHAFDGMLGAFQIQRMFFDSWRTTRERLSKLYQNGYIDRPNRMQRASITQMIYWLTEHGANIVAGLNGQDLREFYWRKQPKWSMVEHDLSVNDFRIAISVACAELSGFELGEWIPGSEFWVRPDEVEYRDDSGKSVRRRVLPDGFFSIRHFNVTEERWYRFPAFLELDRASEQHPRITNEKVRPGLAYLRSKAYFDRFGGATSGRWVFVTTSQRRLRNMVAQTEAVAGRDAGVFFFTTLEQVTSEAVLTQPIWMRGGHDQPCSLFEIS